MKLHRRKVKEFFAAELGTRADIVRFSERMHDAIYTKIGELNVVAYHSEEPLPYTKRKDGKKIILKPNDTWGEIFDCAWFNFTGTIPNSAKGKNVVLQIDLSGEACIFNDSGEPVGILTTGSTVFDESLGRPGKTEWPITENATGNESIELWADAGNNDLTGHYHNRGSLVFADISIKNTELEQLYYDYSVLINLLGCLDEKTARYQKVFRALHEVMVVIVDYTDDEISKSRNILKPELEKKNGDTSIKLSAIGHAHIDLAWLWPIRETIRKGARTFSNVFRMMERYPDYIFGASQPQLYQFMKDHYPTIFEEIKTKVAEGRWELIGGSWVEFDSNAVSGESFIRQFLIGHKFFKDEFNKKVTNLFLPDTFGYSAQLPQIMKGCGVEHFVTTKMNWDHYNKLPHDTFKWQAIDGTEILTHMPPEGTYNSGATPMDIKNSEAAYEDKGLSDNMLMLFGIGNGGGGPSVDHLENMKRTKNLNGIAPVVQETVKKFFDKLDVNRDEYETWVGELYLGFHQGTYTTQAKNKLFNRKMEYALRGVEFLSIAEKIESGSKYPSEMLDRLWKETLLYQFHDILPGTSIERVHEETFERYSIMLAETENSEKTLISNLANRIDTSQFEKPLIIWNSLSWEREEWIKENDKWMNVKVPSFGYKTFELTESELDSSKLFASEQKLENDLIKISFNENGNIISIFDKVDNRETVKENELSNILSVYTDDGDAWDISPDYRNRKVGEFKLESVEHVVDGPKAIIKQTRIYGSSKMEQKIVLTIGSKKIEFKTKVDWQEREKMLRASFPLSVRSNEATSEIQFGHIKRATHSNSSWELAQYEISAHKWIDISQADYGVALLNDCKYGFYTEESLLDINLIRTPKWPTYDSDIGINVFTYVLLPHGGGHIGGDVIKEAYELNIPLNISKSEKSSGDMPLSKSYVSTDSENVIIETIKKAEESENIIVRLYEAFGMSKKVKINIGFDFKKVFETNLVEEEITELKTENGIVEIELTPFKIKTISVEI